MPSSVIRGFDYDPAAQLLEIVFVSGRRYRYEAVPPSVAAALRASRAKGEFFNSAIRDRFAFTRVA